MSVLSNSSPTQNPGHPGNSSATALRSTCAPSTSDAIPQCNGNGEAANGGIGICETLRPVDGGLFDRGIVSNQLRDWLGDGATGTGSLGTPFQSLAVYEARESVTQDISANLKWRANDQWFFEFDAHYTDAEATLDRLWAGGNHFGDYAYDFTDPMNPSIALFQPEPSCNHGSHVVVNQTPRRPLWPIRLQLTCCMPLTSLRTIRVTCSPSARMLSMSSPMMAGSTRSSSVFAGLSASNKTAAQA